MRHDAAAAAATTIGFDDLALDPVNTPVPLGYAGFIWRKLGVQTPTPSTAGSGYETGVTSGDQAAYAYGGAPVTMALPRGRFTLESVALTSARNTSQQVDIYGYHRGVEKYHVTVTISDRAPTVLDLDFVDVRRVVFVASNGFDDPALEGQGDHIVFDDLVVSDLYQRPAPAAFGADRGGALHAAMPADPMGLLALV